MIVFTGFQVEFYYVSIRVQDKLYRLYKCIGIGKGIYRFRYRYGYRYRYRYVGI